jgi:hypothetical protein
MSDDKAKKRTIIIHGFHKAALAKVKLAEQKLAAYLWAVGDIHAYGFPTQDVLDNAKTIIYAALVRDLNRAYADMTAMLNVFPEGDNTEAERKALRNYFKADGDWISRVLDYNSGDIPDWMRGLSLATDLQEIINEVAQNRGVDLR